jgi:hypothetical protein
MEPSELIKALISAVGPIVGAIVAIAAIWAKEILEARKNTQSWFEQTYITEGIDPLLAYLRLQDVLLTTLFGTTQTVELQGVGRFPSVDNLANDVPSRIFPVEALVRIETLLKTKEYTALIATLPEFTRLYSNIEPEKRIAPVLSDKINLVRDGYNSLATIRQELLEAKVNKKKEVRKLHENQSIKNTLTQFAQQSQRWNERNLDRDRLISQSR